MRGKRNSVRSFVILLALVAGVSAVPAGADVCPTSGMSLAYKAPFTSTAATLDSTSTYQGEMAARGTYDIPQGTLQIFHGGSLYTSSVTARDDYDVVGVAPGTPVTVTVQITFDGTIATPGCGSSGCWGYLRATIRWQTTHADDVQQKNTIADTFTTESVHGQVSLPVTIVAGQPERIEFELAGYRSPGGNQIENGTGTIRFVGLDPSLRIVSCQGYGAGVVPARPKTWGSLKLLYR